MFILMGGLGASLVALAGLGMWLSSSNIEGRYVNAVLICAWVILPIGVVMCAVGFVQGKRAGELDISAYTRARPRDYHVAGREIEFVCPSCRRSYRASPLLGGKPFICRECQVTFNVPNGLGEASAK
jgi:hypothetical protein